MGAPFTLRMALACVVLRRSSPRAWTAVVAVAALAAGCSRSTLAVDPPRPVDLGAVDLGRPDLGAADQGPPDEGPCGPPVPEACNGRDDDCDLRVDEDLAFGEVEPRRVVRSDQGVTGDCSTCRWAGGAQLFVHPDGLLAVWRLGFNGTAPRPNAFARRLAPDGTPLGEPFELFTTNVPNGFQLTAIGEDRAALAFCGRFGNEDVMTSAFVDPRGDLLVPPQERTPMGVSCGAQLPGVGWSGERVFFGWTTNRGPQATRGVYLDQSDPEGRSRVGETVIDTFGDLSVAPRFARGHGRLAMVAGTIPEDAGASRLRFMLFRPDGEVEASVEIDAMAGFFLTAVDVAPSADGWLVVGRSRWSRNPGRVIVRLTAGGEVLEGPLAIEPELSWLTQDLEAWRGGGFVLGGVVSGPDGASGVGVARLDDRGRRIDLWRPSTPESIGLQGFDLVLDGGRALLLHPVGGLQDFEPNDVVLRTLGCTGE